MVTDVSDARPQAIPVLQPGGRLLHIGFHKTGTTALQSAFASARKQLKEHGVRYPGKQDHHSRPALAVNQRVRWASRGGVRADPKYWPQLLKEIEKAPDRSVISSEFFSEAGPEVVERIITDLGGPQRVHVVATLRPFDRILPSSWQQYVKGGMRASYSRWLKGVLADPPTEMSPTFWQRHDHPAVLARWADVVGANKVTLVVLDESDRSMMFRTFEQMLALPADLLVSQPRKRDNRSLTAAEAELLRRINMDVMPAGVTWDAYTKVIRYGAVRRFTESRTPGPEEQPIVTPKWAIERAAEIGAREVGQLKATGITIVGDLDSLAETRIPAGKPRKDHATVPLDVAVQAVLGAFYATAGEDAFLRDPGPEGEGPRPITLTADRRRVGELSTRSLLKIARRRVRRRLTRGMRR